MPLPGLQHANALSQMHIGRSLPHNIVQPFLDLERERNKNLAVRAFGAPIGSLAVHAPIMPAATFAPDAAAGGAGMVSPAQAAVEGLGMNAPWATGAGDFASSVAGHMGPLLLMSGLGAAGGIGLAALAGKLYSKMRKRKRENIQQRIQQGVRSSRY